MTTCRICDMVQNCTDGRLHNQQSRHDGGVPINAELMQRIHDLRGTLQVVTGFLRWLDARTLTTDGQALHEACRVSLERMAIHVERIHALVQEVLPAVFSGAAPVQSSINDAQKSQAMSDDWSSNPVFVSDCSSNRTRHAAVR
ncbi:MAG: hypothetical protein HYV02_08095 [Deltaproteobacteria bacterium]|nr:hypothetical protein [Deltaproteobacteria bacterium]